MKNRLLAAAILALPVALLIWFFWQARSAKAHLPRENAPSQGAAVAAALAKQDPATVKLIETNFAQVQSAPESEAVAAAVALAPSGPQSPLQFTNCAPGTVLESVRRAVRQYGARFGGNPVGNNPEITAALAGNNPKQLNFLDAAAGMRVNESGEMLDSWGTPLFFHQLSGTETEIRSAGPDKVMWTFDDLVAK